MGIGVECPAKISAWSPAYIERVAQVMNTVDLATLRSFCAGDCYRPSPVSIFQPLWTNEKFSFESRAMLGLQQQARRERRCLSAITANISGPGASAVVHQMFSADEIKSVTRMAEEVEAALGNEIDGLAWMELDASPSRPHRTAAADPMAVVRFRLDRASDRSFVAQGSPASAGASRPGARSLPSSLSQTTGANARPYLSRGPTHPQRPSSCRLTVQRCRAVSEACPLSRRVGSRCCHRPPL